MASPPTFSHVPPLSPPTKYKYMRLLLAVATPSAPSSSDAPARLHLYAGLAARTTYYYVYAASPGCPNMAGYSAWLTWSHPCNAETLCKGRAHGRSHMEKLTSLAGNSPRPAQRQRFQLRGRGLPAGTCYMPELNAAYRTRFSHSCPLPGKPPAFHLPTGEHQPSSRAKNAYCSIRTKRPCPPNLRPGLGHTDSVALRCVASGSWGADKQPLRDQHW